MEEKEMRRFSLAGILLVTGFCFLLFTLLLSIVDGVNIKLFLWIGLITFVLGLLNGTYILMSQANSRNKSNLAP